jgi:predicted DNA-binding WGR domain protein
MQTTALPFAIILERHDPARYMTRYYTLALERNLFGEWSLVRMWGRIGQTRQTRITLCVDLPTTQNAYARKLREKRRRDYA